MRTSAILIIGILFVAAHQTQAQSPVVFKYKGNPSYSVHNYKHPDKAAIARKYNLDNLVTLDYIKINPADNKAKQNYKVHTVTTPAGVSGAVVPTTTRKKSDKKVNSPANYKHQF